MRIFVYKAKVLFFIDIPWISSKRSRREFEEAIKFLDENTYCTRNCKKFFKDELLEVCGCELDKCYKHL
jgi:hypothetical protein